MVIETAIIVAIITGCFSVIGQWLVYRKSKDEDDKKRAVKDKEVDMILAQILERLDTHNNYAEKLGDIAVEIAEIKTELKMIKQS
jgi:long-subunit acyl-CoA synthetase (AMP-forming)